MSNKNTRNLKRKRIMPNQDINIETYDNEFDSGDDSDYMRDLDDVFENFQINSDNESESDDNISPLLMASRRGLSKSDPGPSFADLIESDSSDETFQFSRQRRLRRLSSSSENDVQNIPVADQSVWVNVTNEDNYCPNIDFTTGDKVPGPQIPASCTTPLQFFQLFFTDDLIRKITSETNKYAAKIIATKTLSKHSIWKTWVDVNEVEMKAFLGVVINMGLIEVPEMQDYWSLAFHSQIPFFGTIFSRKRFMQIFWSLHLESIQLDDSSLITRTQKVNNYLLYIESKCKEHFIPNENLSIDESTVGFKGKISFLAYNPKKPIKWGLRVYVLADSAESYIYSFVPYYGKITTDGLIRPDLSFTSRIVLHLYNNLKKSIPDAAGYHIFTDRFYTNIVLANELYVQGCFLTGTIMPNRKGLPEQLKKPKLPKGKTLAFRKQNVLSLAWYDTRVVTALSTYYKSRSETVRRRPARAKRGNIRSHRPIQNLRIEVKKPSLIVNYNKHMGGVDVADQYASSYCFIRKTLKWWRKLFFWGVEVSIINSFILHRMCAIKKGNKPLSHKVYRQKLLMSLIGDFRAPTTSRSISTAIERVQRLDGTPHFIYLNSDGKHKDCLVCSNRKIKGGRRETCYFCNTCEAKPSLHPGLCFEKYHTKSEYKNNI